MTSTDEIDPFLGISFDRYIPKPVRLSLITTNNNLVTFRIEDVSLVVHKSMTKEEFELDKHKEKQLVKVKLIDGTEFETLVVPYHIIQHLNTKHLYSGKK